MTQHKKMTKAQLDKKEDIVKGMKKNFNQFRQEYGDKAKEVMYATATKRAMEEDTEEVYVEHWCAKHVYHDVYGEGVVLEGQHDVPDENGYISWYTVQFDHGDETVFTEDVEIMHERHHGHMMKKKKKVAEDMHDVDDSLPAEAKKKMHAKGVKFKGAEKGKDAVEMKEEDEEIEEELSGNQHKIDANKNGKIDAHDFKLLRKIKKARG